MNKASELPQPASWPPTKDGKRRADDDCARRVLVLHILKQDLLHKIGGVLPQDDGGLHLLDLALPLVECWSSLATQAWQTASSALAPICAGESCEVQKLTGPFSITMTLDWAGGSAPIAVGLLLSAEGWRVGCEQRLLDVIILRLLVTRGQVRCWQQQIQLLRKVRPDSLLDGAEDVLSRHAKQRFPADRILVAAEDAPEVVGRQQVDILAQH